MDPLFDIDDYNDKGELKTPPGLVLGLLFLSRHILFLLLGGLSEFVGRGAGGGFSAAPLGLPPAWSLLLDLPVFAFLILVLRKDKLSQNRGARRIFRWGIWPPAAFSLIQLGSFAAVDFSLRSGPSMAQSVELVLLVGCLVYFLRDRKLRVFLRQCAGPIR